MYGKDEDKDLSLIVTGRQENDRQERERMRQRRYLRYKKRRRQVLIARSAAVGILLLLLLLISAGVWKLGEFVIKRRSLEETVNTVGREDSDAVADNQAPRPDITEDFLTPNPYSRPGEKLPEVTELFVHYTANAGTSAAQNRSYFENLAITRETSASAHFVIGYEGEILQCLPLDEIGYAVKEHNYNSISIECCYLESDGEFTPETYQSLIRLLAWLMKEYGLDTSSLYRHYDYSGKRCPLYYVEHPKAWEKLKQDVADYIAASTAL